jgi:hypothetical protein
LVDNIITLYADLKACRQLVEEYANRHEEAVIERYRSGKSVFFNLSEAEDLYIKQKCKSTLSKLSLIIPDALAQWQNIIYPIDLHRDFMEISHGVWVQRRTLLRLLENILRNKIDIILDDRVNLHPDISNLITVLFLASNPIEMDRLSLDLELDAIDVELWDSKFRDRFILRQKFALKIEDLSKQLVRHNPQIVHFTGHGNEKGEIILQDERGLSCPVKNEDIIKTFSILKSNIKCVILSACYSEPQAAALSEYIDCVIGMSTKFIDEASIKFAQGFYRGLGGGYDLQKSFDLACDEVRHYNLDEANTPKIKWKGNKPQKIFLFKNNSKDKI